MNVPKTSGPNQEGKKKNLDTIIEESLEREMFVRIQKNLILIKALADSCSKATPLAIANKAGKDSIRESIPSREEISVFRQAIEQAKAAQRRVSAIVSPLVYQLYPDQIDTITLYIADVTMACAEDQDLPMGLLSEIELPKAQEELLSLDNEELINSKIGIQNSTITHGGIESREHKSVNNLRSREYYLCVASICLSETVDQMDKLFQTKVEKLMKLIRPDITSIENACSRINKLFSKKKKWVWSSDFKTF